MRDERDIHVPTLAALLERLRAHVGDGVPLTISYHPDADPGGGRGWSVEVGDRHTYGTAGEALTQAVSLPSPDNEIAASEDDLHAICPNCISEEGQSDEDRCCLTCGADLIVVADGHSADVLLDVLRPAARKAGGGA